MRVWLCLYVYTCAETWPTWHDQTKLWIAYTVCLRHPTSPQFPPIPPINSTRVRLLVFVVRVQSPSLLVAFILLHSDHVHPGLHHVLCFYWRQKLIPGNFRFHRRHLDFSGGEKKCFRNLGIFICSAISILAKPLW